jgi:hypothetical protein
VDRSQSRGSALIIKEGISMKNPNAPRITLALLEHTLVFGNGDTMAERPDLCGNLPLPKDVPVRRRVSIEEFERDMRR